MYNLDQPPNLPSDMVPPNATGMQQPPAFPMGDRTVILQTAMQVEKMLAQLGQLSPTMAALCQNFIDNFRKTLVESLPAEQQQSPSPVNQANVLLGQGGQY